MSLHILTPKIIFNFPLNFYFLFSRKVGSETLKVYPNYDYLADIQDILLDMDEVSASEILILLGEELMTMHCTGIIERAFRSLGADFQEFLGSLDGVYDVLKIQEVRIFIGLKVLLSKISLLPMILQLKHYK